MPQVQGNPDSNEKLFAVACHGIALLCSYFLVGVLAPLVIKALKNDSTFVAEHARESINFQLSLLIWAVIGFALCFVAVGFVVLGVLALFAFVCPIIAIIRAANGDHFRYPLTIRFIRG